MTVGRCWKNPKFGCCNVCDGQGCIPESIASQLKSRDPHQHSTNNIEFLLLSRVTFPMERTSPWGVLEVRKRRKKVADDKLHFDEYGDLTTSPSSMDESRLRKGTTSRAFLLGTGLD